MEIQTDGGPEFIAREFSELAKGCMGISTNNVLTLGHAKLIISF